LLSGQVCDRRIDATAEILKNHGVLSCDLNVAGYLMMEDECGHDQDVEVGL
jgi:hypothetical protein